jgi:hypothetical protein
MILGDDDLVIWLSRFYKLIDSEIESSVNLVRCNLNILKKNDELEKNSLIMNLMNFQTVFGQVSLNEAITASKFIFSRVLYLKMVCRFFSVSMVFRLCYLAKIIQESYHLASARIVELSNENISSNRMM